MTDTLPVNTTWPLWQRFVFRFFLLFFILFIFFNPNGSVPLLNVTYDTYIQPMHNMAVWAAAHIFHLPQPLTTFTNGSGDTTYDYIVLLFCFTVATLSAIIWSAINRKECNYNKFYYWIIVILRFYIGLTMINYGMAKVIKLQFPYPSYSRLIEPYGNSSPMGLAWTFMGYSRGYNYFTGFAELTCGILLLFRRTTTLGAVIALVVAANIMAINYCFDVPVKIVSTMLVTMSLFILSKDLYRFINFFIMNREAAPANNQPMQFRVRWKNITLIVLKYLTIFYMVASTVDNAIQMDKQFGDRAPKFSLSGLYDAATFVRNRDTVASLITDSTRWRRLVIGSNGYARVYYMNDTVKTFIFKSDTARKVITMYTDEDTLHRYTLNYRLNKPDIMVLHGFFKSDSFNIRLIRFNDNNFLLKRRGFHWINEMPLNR